MRQGIAISTQDPRLHELCKELGQSRDRVKEKMKFVEKQAETIKKDYESDAKKNWNAIQSYLIEKGLLKADYDSEKETLTWQQDTGLIYLSPKDEDDDMPSGLKAILHKLFH